MKILRLFSILLFSILSLFVIASCASSNSIKLDKYYTNYSQESGDLYFIYENNDFENIENNTDLLFDITLQQGQENVTINYTFFTDEVKNTNALTFESDKKKIAAPANKLFVGYDKNKWKHRYSAKIGYEEFKEFVNNTDQPPIIGVDMTDDESLTYTTKNNKWNKYSNAVKKIISLYEAN